MEVKYQEELNAVQGSEYIAPFSLLRVASLPYDSLNALRMVETEEHVRLLIDLEHEIGKLKVKLADAFFRLVSSLGEDEVTLRREALKIKRNIHNNKAVKSDPDVLRELTLRMPRKDHMLFERFCNLNEQLNHTLDSAQQIYKKELQSALRVNMREPLKHKLFSRALALASPGVANNAASEKNLPEKGSPTNFERSLFGYLLRAAAKTSPFSSFMSMTALPVSARFEANLSGSNLTYACRTRLNRGIPARLYKAIALYLVKKDLVPLTLNNTFAAQGNNRFSALCGREMVLLGRPWSETRLASFRFQEQLARVFIEGAQQDSWSNWIERVAEGGQISPQQATDLILKFINKGILNFPAFTDSFDALPEITLLNILTKWQAHLPEGVLADLSSMIGLVERLEVDESRERAQKIEHIRKLEEKILNTVSTVPSQRFHNVTLEDCWSSGFNNGISTDVLTDLNDLKAFLSTQISFLPEYVRLVELFVERFGENGECRDVAAFLTEAGDKLVDLPEYGANAVEQKVVYAPHGAKLGVTAQIQLVNDASDLPPRIVVNRVFDRAGWLAARFAMGEENEKAFLRNALSEWLTTLSGDAEPVDLLINGHCNDLQTHPRLLKRTFSWPDNANERSANELLRVENLALRHDKETGVLTLLEGTKPINLVYLGSTFPTPSWGIKFALTILTQPYTLTRPKFKPPVLSEAEPVIFNDRITHGNAILSRAFWWVKSDYLRQYWFSDNDVKGMVNITKQLALHGMPDTFFVVPFNNDSERGAISSDVLKGERKPLWVDVKNPFSLSLLKRLADKHDWLSFTEALPGPEELWLEVDGKKHVSELQLEMIVEAQSK